MMFPARYTDAMQISTKASASLGRVISACRVNGFIVDKYRQHEAYVESRRIRAMVSLYASGHVMPDSDRWHSEVECIRAMLARLDVVESQPDYVPLDG